MQVSHQALEPVIEHVGIDLRGRDVRVAEELLHDPKVGPVMQEVACEGVTQHVWTDAVRPQAGGYGAGLEIAGEGLAGQVARSAVGGEQPGSARLKLRLVPEREIPGEGLLGATVQ